MKIDNNSNPVTNNEFKEGAIKYVESIIYYVIENYLKILWIFSMLGYDKSNSILSSCNSVDRVLVLWAKGLWFDPALEHKINKLKD